MSTIQGPNRKSRRKIRIRNNGDGDQNWEKAPFPKVLNAYVKME